MIKLATQEAPAIAATERASLPPMVAFVGATLAFVGFTFAAGAPSPLFVLFQQQWHFPAWVLTLAFAIYAITLLATLLTAGSLSDFIGRRPVMIGALLVEAFAMLLFVFADNIGQVIVARAIQGIATGAATSTFTAAIVELAPERLKKVGALIGSTAPVGGLALGALFTGLAIQFTTAPSMIIFTFLIVVFLASAVIVLFSAETGSRRDGALRSLIPHLAVPDQAKREFFAGIPALVATWMLAGLFFGLAPSIIREIFNVNSGLVNGLLVALSPIAGVIAALSFGRFDPRRATLVGLTITLIGLIIIILATVSGWFPLLFVAAIVSGTSFGAAFTGVLRTLAPLAIPSKRAEMFAAIYLVNYLAYGGPALIAGEVIGVVGLLNTVIGYGAIAIIVAAIGLSAQLRLARATQPA